MYNDKAKQEHGMQKGWPQPRQQADRKQQSCNLCSSSAMMFWKEDPVHNEHAQIIHGTIPVCFAKTMRIATTVQQVE